MRGNIVTTANENAVTVKVPAKHCQNGCEGCYKDNQCKYQDYALGRGKSNVWFYF